MFSKEMCVAAQLPEAWDVHLERGERWEGLIYQNHVVDLRTIYPQKRYKRDADLVIRKEPRSTGLHLKHPNQARWQRVLDKMQKHLLFDIDIVIQYAIEEGLFTADTVRKTTASEHLKTWVDNGKIKRIFSGYYRSEMFWRWNAKRNEHDPPRLPQTLDWMLSFAFWQAPRQYHIPNLTFTLQEVVNWLESQPEEKRKQWFGDRPLRRGMITERLRAYLEKDYVEVAANRKWRLSSYMITNTRPRWSKPGDDLEPVLPGSYKRRAILLSSMPIDQAIKQIAGDEHMGILHMMTTRILKDEDQSLLDGRLAKLAKRTFLKSRPNLLKAYMDGKLDEEY